MNMKYIAVFACIIMAVMLVAPIISVNAGKPFMNVIQYRYYSNQDQLFNALLTPDSAGGVDIMDWPLTGTELGQISGNKNIQVCPTSEADEFELAFNNNWTDGASMTARSPMNFTDFRNAMNCLVDSNGVIAGLTLRGFATRDYTQIPEPLLTGFVNPSVSGSNYPWEFNVNEALQILWTDGWYSNLIYPTFASLLDAYTSGSLSTAGGTANGVVYSGNDTNGQWGGGDPQATANAALTNVPLQPLVGYVRSDEALKDLGDNFCAELHAIGCPYIENYKQSLAALRPYVIDAQTYDFATLSYVFSSPPNWFYTECTPLGIYSGGPNPYLIDDANMTYWATMMYNNGSLAGYQACSNAVQNILVMESELVSAWSIGCFNAYKAGVLGMIDESGYSFGGQVHSSLLEWIFLNCRKNNTIVYPGSPPGTPDSNIIYYGELNPPDMINPIFSNNIFDSEIEDEIFTYPMAHNPYNDIVPGSAITGVPAGSDLPWMAYSWKTSLIPAQDGSGGQWTNVTFWFRNDITWQDGVPFTVNDINYTIGVNAFYGDAYANAAARCCANASDNYMPYFTAGDNWTCSILVTNPSWLALYTPLLEILPQHLYQYIMPNNITAAEQGLATDGLHGIWPGQAAVSSNILPGAPFTLSQLNNSPETTLVGTGPWKYRVGSTSASQFVPGGGITLDEYADFPITFVGHNDVIAPGEIAFKYTWLATSPSAQPSGGYFKVGLSDLVYLANAYGTTGTYPPTGGLNGVPGAAFTWNPAANIAGRGCTVGLSDLVTLAEHYGWYWGNYSYNAPYPPSEKANGGP